jgi:CRP-like cAMP-binding protein
MASDGHYLHITLILGPVLSAFKKDAPAIAREHKVSRSTPPIAVRNQLLANSPPEVLASLMPRLRWVSLAVRDSLIVADRTIEAVYFVESGWVSLVATLEDGTQAEVGLVGREGMVGFPLILGVDTGFEDAFVQASGSALQMEADTFRRTLEEIPILQARLYRYSEAMRSQAVQAMACNGRHPLEQRFARWLLMAHDRSDGDDLSVTQEFLPGITMIASILQQAGIIRCSHRGQITILDRRMLEATACDCYATLERRFDALLGPQS